MSTHPVTPTSGGSNQAATEENQKEGKAKCVSGSPASVRSVQLHSQYPVCREAFRAKLATLLEHRLFYIPSFKIYGAEVTGRTASSVSLTVAAFWPGGVAGLYDYGPTGCAVKANITAFWRKVRFLGAALGSAYIQFHVMACVLTYDATPSPAFRSGGGHDGGRVPQRHTRDCAQGIRARGPVQRPHGEGRKDTGLLPRRPPAEGCVYNRAHMHDSVCR